MGRKLVSFLCGGLSRKKSPPPAANPVEENPKIENSDASTKPGPSLRSSDNPEDHRQPPAHDEQQLLPPPPGRQQLRAASCHHQHQRSSSAASKLMSSMSMRVLGGGGGSRREEKKLEHEDSIWKKTIILGEKCRIPDEEDDAILYDENGNRISTYHPKHNGNSISFSRQNSSGTDMDEETHNRELSRK
ncbi:hypothetical protein CDL12_14150 [Handroanthus impetiginosus]|uniref:Uncharacterized protein n=1 Tax=Handroanthus impetiginosus TaxID=429701 RepID=A0A2G9H6T9_9LAMI|nr:hypothetical protein CDL12_14150 [Handroanthus impetiginosus]